jgi:hypothetical protein
MITRQSTSCLSPIANVLAVVANQLAQESVPTGCGHMIGPDHRSLVVKCPDGHDWMIESRASNCTIGASCHHWAAAMVAAR